MKNESILLILPYGSVGGMERLALTFYKHYISQGYRVKVVKLIKLASDIINFGADEYFLSTIDFVQMSKVNRLFFYLKAPFRLRKIIIQEKITHSISFGDMTNIFSSLTFTQEFKVGSIHSLKSRELKQSKVFASITKIGFRSTYSNFDKLVCISKAIKNDLKDNCGYKFSNLCVTYNPHDIAKIQQLGSEPITNTNELKIFNKKTIVYLGRISVQKSQWHLVKAFYLLKNRGLDVNLLIIGDGDKNVKEHLLSLIKLYKLDQCVFFIGRKKNPYKYLKASQALVLSSHYEGTPNVIVESIALGIPVVSSFSTKGIVELMSSIDIKESTENIILKSGVITPNLFKGKLGIPNNNDIISEEVKLSEGLLHVLNSKTIKKTLDEQKNELLLKFDKAKISEDYLSPIKYV